MASRSSFDADARLVDHGEAAILEYQRLCQEIMLHDLHILLVRQLPAGQRGEYV